MNEFYNRSTKSWLKNAKVNVYFTLDKKEKSVVAERCIRNFKKLKLKLYDCFIKKKFALTNI